jgi:hypothetical protein
VHLDAQASTTLEVEPTPDLGIYVLQGQIKIGDTLLTTGALGLLSSGTQVHIAAHGDEAVELALLGGQPVQGKVLFSGPFVMDTPARLEQAKRDFASGRMGRLEGVPF